MSATIDKDVTVRVDTADQLVVVDIDGVQALQLDQNTALTLGDWIIQAADSMREEES